RPLGADVRTDVDPVRDRGPRGERVLPLRRVEPVAEPSHAADETQGSEERLTRRRGLEDPDTGEVTHPAGHAVHVDMVAVTVAAVRVAGDEQLRGLAAHDVGDGRGRLVDGHGDEATLPGR